jgi:predicted ATP-binding protein involved in virulence
MYIDQIDLENIRSIKKLHWKITAAKEVGWHVILIDAHLHPTWQKNVGKWFQDRFPNIQFIVTTHSPLICQAATHGSVWHLPHPGSDEKGGMGSGKDLVLLI